MNNKGVSMVALVITIIVIVIIASVATMSGSDTMQHAEKATIQADFKTAQTLFQTYNNEAIIKGDRGYDPDKFCWDGESERAENTAKIENGVDEDTIRFIFKDKFPHSLRGRIYIQDGEFYVFPELLTEKEWIDEVYERRSEAQKRINERDENQETPTALPTLTTQPTASVKPTIPGGKTVVPTKTVAPTKTTLPTKTTSPTKTNTPIKTKVPSKTVNP
jgi:hypothetical protein